MKLLYKSCFEDFAIPNNKHDVYMKKKSISCKYERSFCKDVYDILKDVSMSWKYGRSFYKDMYIIRKDVLKIFPMISQWKKLHISSSWNWISYIE